MASLRDDDEANDEDSISAEKSGMGWHYMGRYRFSVVTDIESHITKTEYNALTSMVSHPDASCTPWADPCS